MHIKFSTNLDQQEIYATGAELTGIMGKDKEGEKLLVHTFDHPLLVTDNYRIAKLNPTLRDTLFSILSSRPRIVEYDGVSVYWDDSHKGVWSPSIDTLIFAKALNKVFSDNPNIKTAIEIGTGSGFLSKFIFSKSKSLQSITINDINPFAIKSAQDNFSTTKANYVLGDGLKEIEGKTYDLIICNPPYIPRPKSVENNPYEGISILNYLVHQGQKHLNPGGVILVGTSNLADGLVFSKPPKLKFEALEELEVPLKINNVLNNEEWLSYLQNRNLKKQNHNGYEFWHHIKTIYARNDIS